MEEAKRFKTLAKAMKTYRNHIEIRGLKRLLLDSERFGAADEQLSLESRLAGHTALHTAAEKGQREAAMLLLEHPKFTKARWDSVI